MSAAGPIRVGVKAEQVVVQARDLDHPSAGPRRSTIAGARLS